MEFKKNCLRQNIKLVVLLIHDWGCILWEEAQPGSKSKIQSLCVLLVMSAYMLMEPLSSASDVCLHGPRACLSWAVSE